MNVLNAEDIAEIVADLLKKSAACEEIAASDIMSGESEQLRLQGKADAYDDAAQMVLDAAQRAERKTPRKITVCVNCDMPGVTQAELRSYVTDAIAAWGDPKPPPDDVYAVTITYPGVGITLVIDIPAKGSAQDHVARSQS
jgi:hypothetical protein